MHTLEQETDLSPWSSEAESAVLGGLLLDNQAWENVGDILLPKHFYGQANGQIFFAISSLISASKPADIFTVLDFMQTAGLADGVDIQILHALAQYVPSASNIRRYSEIVFERALVRGMLSAADKAKAMAIEAGMPVADRLNKVQDLFQSLQVKQGREVPRHVGEAAMRMLTRINDMNDGKIQPGIQTKIPGLDRRLGGGLKGGKQIVLAARPAVGKSSLALAIGINLAKEGHAAGFLSMEMTSDELTDRTTANLGRISLENITTGKLTSEEWPFLTMAVDELRALPLYFDEQPALTLNDIQAKARMLKRQHDINLLIVDYIQLCAGRNERDNRNSQIEEISRGLKTLAKQLDITIITLSQLSRGVETRASQRPVMSDLKDSGSIEQDADVIILLSVNHVRSDGAKVIEAEIVKNRQGSTGSVMLAFNGDHQRWVETIMDPSFRKPAAKSYTEDL